DNDSKTQLTYSAGLQFNVYNGLVLDVAYEGSGSGDWKTSGFNVGLGYKF
ncbi:Ail/Lom family outer membrane beta-barrel protein, partial [Salmonella enterica]